MICSGTWKVCVNRGPSDWQPFLVLARAEVLERLIQQCRDQGA